MRWRPTRRRCSWAAALLLAFVLAVPLLSATAESPAIVDPVMVSEAAQAGTVTLLDVRSPNEWRTTGLPKGAKPVTIHDPEGIAGFVAAATRAVGGMDRPVALICARGARSSRAATALREAGFTNLLNVREGMEGNPVDGPGWLARELPVDSCKHC